MRTYENSEDPNEMLHDAAFQPYMHLHYLPRNNTLFIYNIQLNLEIMTGDLSSYTMNHSKFAIPILKETSIYIQWVVECFIHFYNTDNSSSHKYVVYKCYWKRTCTCQSSFYSGLWKVIRSCKWYRNNSWWN